MENNHAKQKNFSVKKRMQSFAFAFNGLKILFKNEHNSWIHLFSAVIAISLGLLLKINSTEWCFIFFSIAIVFFAELFNTAIEELTNIVSPNYSKKAKTVKDLAAAGVLISAIIALTIGSIIFTKKIIDYLICF